MCQLQETATSGESTEPTRYTGARNRALRHGSSWMHGLLKQINGGQRAVYGVNLHDDIFSRLVDGSGI